MSHKTFAVISCTIALVIVAGTGSANYLVDPLFQYRPPRSSEWFKRDFQRQVNPGRVRNLYYDTIVIGSSMAENFRQSEIDRLFGGKSLNLSFSGMKAFEARIMLEYALGQRKVVRAIISVDHDTFLPLGDSARQEDNFPREYYDSSLLNDYRYLLSFEMLKYSAYQVSGLKGRDAYRDRDAPWFWGDEKKQSRTAVLMNWVKWRHQCGDSQARPEEMVDLFVRNVLDVAERNPDTTFELFFSPYSIVRWHWMAECGKLDLAMAFRAGVVARSAKLANVNIHDFQADAAITTELDNYKDMGHFGAEISSELLERIAAGNSVVNSSVVEEHNDRIRKQVASLDLASLENEVAARAPRGKAGSASR